MDRQFKLLNDEIVHCRLCPRLVEFREHVPIRREFQNQAYWRKPVPGFGDEKAWLLIVGLAPAAQGGNRIGRIFTGDKSGHFLMNALYKAKFANQPTSISREDGLRLSECYMTPVVKCVPPQDRPTAIECLNCSQYLQRELSLLKGLTHVLALGKIAFDRFLFAQKALGNHIKRAHFAHGQRYCFPGLPILYASYHPSPQNTNTGRLTAEEFLRLLQQIRNEKETR